MGVQRISVHAVEAEMVDGDMVYRVHLQCERTCLQAGSKNLM